MNYESVDGLTTPGAAQAGSVLRFLRLIRGSEVEPRLRDGDDDGLRQIVDALPTGVVLADARQRDMPLVFANPAFLALTGYNYDDVVGRNCRFLQGPETSLEAVATMREALREGRQHSVVLQNSRRDGTTFWNEVTLAPMYDVDGKVSYFLGVQSNVTMRVKAEQERALLMRHSEEMRVRAERDVHARNEFLSAATHDLRTPITTLRGRAQLVQRKMNREQTIDATWLREQMDAITAATTLMMGTIDELSDVARLQAGRTLELQIGPVDIGLLAHAVGDDLAVQHGMEMIKVSSPADPAVVQGDRARLERVLQNIVGNSVKYSDANTPIDITVRTAGNGVVTTVRDVGVGIPSDELPSVFEHYYRASTARGVTGSGLGLTGARAIVLQHGGTLTIESVLGRGTTVSVFLPLIGPAV